MKSPAVDWLSTGGRRMRQLRVGGPWLETTMPWTARSGRARFTTEVTDRFAGPEVPWDALGPPVDVDDEATATMRSRPTRSAPLGQRADDPVRTAGGTSNSSSTAERPRRSSTQSAFVSDVASPPSVVERPGALGRPTPPSDRSAVAPSETAEHRGVVEAGHSIVRPTARAQPDSVRPAASVRPTGGQISALENVDDEASNVVAPAIGELTTAPPRRVGLSAATSAESAGALAELVDRWQAANSPTVVGPNSPRGADGADRGGNTPVDRARSQQSAAVDRSRRRGRAHDEADDRTAAQRRPDDVVARPPSPRSAHQSIGLSDERDHSPEVMLDPEVLVDLVGHALDEVVRRDAERHLLDWSLS